MHRRWWIPLAALDDCGHKAEERLLGNRVCRADVYMIIRWRRPQKARPHMCYAAELHCPLGSMEPTPPIVRLTIYTFIKNSLPSYRNRGFQDRVALVLACELGDQKVWWQLDASSSSAGLPPAVGRPTDQPNCIALPNSMILLT